MRHFEDYEFEHMLNGTGFWWLRWRCKMHLKHCELCRERLRKLKESKQLEEQLRNVVTTMSELTDSRDKDTP